MEGLEISASAVAQVAIMARELERAEPELRAFIDRMDETEQAELVALMWIGRGAFDAAEIEEAVETALAEASTPCATYLLGTPHLSDHLEAALEQFGIDVSDVEDELM